MTDDELRAQLQTAKDFRAARIAHAKNEIAQAQRDLRDAEHRLARWTQMIPAEVIQHVDDLMRREASDAKATEEEVRRKRMHDAALRESRERSKGMLPPEAASKSTSFGIYGS